jgi:starch phosphorylase
VSEDLAGYYDRYIGSRWRNEPAENGFWHNASQIPAEELWRVHERRRERLILFARRRLQQQLEHRGAAQADIEAASGVLDPERLTVGFARRFATYKRATLLLRDTQRLERIVNDPQRPVQFIFAGKAHPKDEAGKELIRQVVTLSRQPQFRHGMVFIEDYDMEIARFLVQGCDVWMNNPRRPQEASGTSGMKAAANGVLNFSTLDGWWDEAWERFAGLPAPIGWPIGRGEEYENADYQDQLEADDIYDVLERDIVPTFYDRGNDRIPRAWVGRMHATIQELCPFVTSHRMLRDYVEQFYMPSAERYRALSGDNLAGARDLAAWRGRLEAHWDDVRVAAIESTPPAEVQVGASVQAQVRVYLGPLQPTDIRVELYMGRLNADGEIVDAEANPMQLVGPDGGQPGTYLYELDARPWRISGLHGYTVRILPHHPDQTSPFLPGLIAWATTDGAAVR